MSSTNNSKVFLAGWLEGDAAKKVRDVLVAAGAMIEMVGNVMTVVSVPAENSSAPADVPEDAPEEDGGVAHLADSLDDIKFNKFEARDSFDLDFDSDEEDDRIAALAYKPSKPSSDNKYDFTEVLDSQDLNFY
ncbi:hypothetical protein SEMRO_237_G095270.1 [Seminavis robusta]|uniref:Uncharacterized protein n=1 Tax=Seminavis robusta TaxID=568900 RepID=A0A9N8DRX7_9STRA|nr:hypothetical protein SEMRO_237_G095270.1 [Seminavis robusta]|eukprot:Sro237_g095270.1 n/a (133) ;mRNA; f:38857-39255